MNWEAIGAVGDTIAAIAVVVSLVYLAIQVKAQNLESRVASTHEIFEGFRNIALPFQNREHAALLVKSENDGYGSLDEAQRIQIISIILPLLRVWEEAFYHRQTGRLDNSIWESITAQYTDLMAISTFQAIWQIRSHNFSEAFRLYVNDLEPGEYRNV